MKSLERCREQLRRAEQEKAAAREGSPAWHEAADRVVRMTAACAMHERREQS